MSDFQSPEFNILVLEVQMKYPSAPSLARVVDFVKPLLADAELLSCCVSNLSPAYSA